MTTTKGLFRASSQKVGSWFKKLICSHSWETEVIHASHGGQGILVVTTCRKCGRKEEVAFL